MSVKRLLLFTAIASLGLSVSIPLTPTAEAGGRSYADVRSASIKMPGQGQNARSIVIPFGKSTMIEVPGGMMDVMVSNQDIVDAVVHTAQRVMLVGKRPGQTNAYIYGQNGEELLDLDIRVERDMKGLQTLIAKHAPGSRVEVASYNNNILLSGSVADAATSHTIVDLANLWLSEYTTGETGEITNLMTVEGNDQVMVKVRIVEMQRSVTKQLGIDFNAVGEIGDATVGLISNSAVGTGSGFAGNLGWNNSGGGPLRSLTAGLQALEKVGLVRTYAEPTITTISGETANFISGGEFPLLTNVFIDEAGQLQREFEYKKFGVAVGVTPTVLSEGRIVLNLSASVSEPTTEGAFETGTNDILAIRNREVNSVIELPAGGSMVVAGLIRQDSRQSSDGTPGLKDVPGVGALFRSRDDENKESELVIIATPYLVKPTHPDKLKTPVDGFIPASDSDAALLGRLNKVYGKNRTMGQQKTLSGPFGHVVD